MTPKPRGVASAFAASQQEDDDEDDVKMVPEAEGQEEEDETGIGHLKAWFWGTLLFFLSQVLNQSSESNHLEVVGSYFHHQGQNREGGGPG